ncbi:protein tweety homolog 1-B-like [Gigantopelta aegis]|uniref:protein tweety homolog 1-B-like n=1 Tax=Gigantopelta aegis TaxID=1735272 RepID=UPI001B889C74|nr:protein tweety homolog 1-B-like [Gigantopelta aegis]
MSTYQYSRIWLADFFHSFPHIDLAFSERTNVTFDPLSLEYKESLGFWIAVPILWCILSLLLFLVYFIIMCCRRKPRKRKNTACQKVFICFLIILGIGAIGAGFYGNEKMDDGVNKMISSFKKTDHTIADSLRTIDMLDQLADDISKNGSQMLQKVLDFVPNVTFQNALREQIENIKVDSKQFTVDVSTIRIDTENFSLDNVKNNIKIFELYRWLATLLLYVIFVFIFVLYFIGVIKSSKCCLIFPTICSMVCLLLVWTATGCFLGFSVALGDLCVDPDAYVEKVVTENSELKKDILDDYLKCTDFRKPFSSNIQDAHLAVTRVTQALNKTVTLCLQYNVANKAAGPVHFIDNELTYVGSNLTALNDISSCKYLHDNYIDAVNGICHTSFIGLAFMVVMSGVIGLTVTFMIAFASRTWPYLSKRRGYYPVDDTDPFLPRPPPYNGYGSMSQPQPEPQAERPITSGSEQSISQLPLPVDESPPPAYRPGQFTSMQEYNNLAPRPSSLHRSSET